MMARLTLPKRAKPSACAGRSGLRPNLLHPWVAQVNGRRELIATDSYTLVRLPVDDDTPLGSIHIEALKRIEAGASHDLHDDRVSVPVSGEAIIDYHAPRVEWPNGSPDPIRLEGDRPAERTIRIALDPRLLTQCARAIGADKSGQAVMLDILLEPEMTTTVRPIIVTRAGAGEGEGHALLMPVRVYPDALPKRPAPAPKRKTKAKR